MRAPNFVRDAAELGSHLFRGSACPHCGRLDTLVGHGLLRGYDPLSEEHVLRGRRMLCSNRYRRPGCGRTLAVLLASMLRRRIASTASLSALWRAFVEGRAASACSEVGLTRRSRARLLGSLSRAQHRVRTWLLALAPVPDLPDPRPLAQLWKHLLVALGETPDPLAELQLRTGQHLLR